MDYIDGISLSKFVIDNKRFPEKIAYDIGSKLALIHRREYKNMGLLNKNLDINKTLLPIKHLHEHYLNGVQGTHINGKIKKEVLAFLTENNEMLKKLEETFVFSHGDFSPSNILIDRIDNTVWFIDFEYSLSAPIYYDIGKFFRDRAVLDEYVEKSTYDSFINGYNEHAKNQIANDWIKLAKLMDITGMLALIDKKNPPNEWVNEIESAIVRSMRILKNEIPF